MIFSVIISEKGGAERRESFERTEINVGRVQGNDLMLPKGNVSKRHARLLFRDGRFIVTDLKSTNGTYVNGRKITQATIVREGDKIYVGDFVLRIEAGASETKPEMSKPGGAELDAAAAPSSSPSEAGLAPDRKGDDELPSERDPEISSAGSIVPGPPRLPSTTVKPGPHLQGPPTITPVPVTTPTPPPNPTASSPKTNSSVPPHPNRTPTPPPPRGVRISSNPPGARDSSPTGPRAYRTIVAQIIERATESFDFDQLGPNDSVEASLSGRLTSVLQELATQVKASGQVADSVTVDQLVADAKRDVGELGPLGPLGPLLVDDDVTEIHIESVERVLAFRKSRRTPTIILRVVNERTLVRAIERLSRDKGQEALVFTNPTYDRRTSQGLHILASSPLRRPRGSVVVLRKPQRSDNVVLEDLVRHGMVSQAIATFLSYLVAVRANILIVSSSGPTNGSLLSALVNIAPADERILVLQDDEPITVQHPNALALPMPTDASDAETKVRTVAHIGADRVVCGGLGAAAIGLADSQAEAGGCLIATTRAMSLRDALNRLPADLARKHAGMSIETAREALASSFHVVIEVARLGDGRTRVLRIAELRMDGRQLISRDIFVFNVERATPSGPIEGQHHSTGTMPVFVEDLAARGVVLEAQLFRRNPGK